MYGRKGGAGEVVPNKSGHCGKWGANSLIVCYPVHFHIYPRIKYSQNILKDKQKRPGIHRHPTF